MSSPVREGAKQMVRLLERMPDERIKHLVSFKQTQMDRFKRVAGLPTSSGESDTGTASVKKPTVNEIKDILNRTNGPLGMKKDMLEKLQAAIPRDQFTDESLRGQVQSMENLLSNKYKNYYDVGDKLYHPAGNPGYYQRIMNELSGQKRESFFTAMRTVFFGK
ncbi:Cbp6p KNAG_0B01390 [Huiozyma naganishii CBS 8797]|uniref:Cytochrome B pre-mRNA-processing protein 6 n=1 Tax=Huiozyma naganishii (strain ATCC MYA-139 / BCRC 22969 / CBS 8797 / KCTC 17520 / NBRC 10181 / NCYC 3082 / Yp74L-3) TaxID=1071383 RepID=J7S4I2_HUIN7|nr:hypothetical protein KNAG_0B01390 [Kazachstania naganishii CBS 8797]CCK68586.1 hypothetical protein KNAG_0B01390 [Kazachstania naganishii CBS 8797]